MHIQILCDSSCDFTAGEKLSTVFQKVPAKVTVSGQVFWDDHMVSQTAFQSAVSRKSLELKVEFPDEQAWMKAFDPSAEAIYLITDSAACSDQYETASRAKRMFLRTRRDQKIHVFNTRSGSAGELLAARRIFQLDRSGCAFRQIAERVERDILRFHTFVLPASVETLCQAGILPRTRLPRPANSLYQMNLNGEMTRAASAVTARGAEQKLLQLIGKTERAGRTCLIAHCGCLGRAQQLAASFRRAGLFSDLMLLGTGAVTSLLLHRPGLVVAY